MIVAIVFIGCAACFALGYMLGDDAGWYRCWRELTKNDSWREQGEEKR